MQFFAVGMRRTRALSPPSSGPKSVDHAVDRSPDLTHCFCVSPICRASPSITSATTEQLIGAKPADPVSARCGWAAENHRKKAAISVSAIRKNSQSTSVTSADLGHASPRNHASAAGLGEIGPCFG
jgi:hypothetical protein